MSVASAQGRMMYSATELSENLEWKLGEVGEGQPQKPLSQGTDHPHHVTVFVSQDSNVDNSPTFRLPLDTRNCSYYNVFAPFAHPLNNEVVPINHKTRNPAFNSPSFLQGSSLLHTKST